MTLHGEISVGDLVIRSREHEVLVNSQEVPLTSREFDIVMMLAEHPGWVYSARQLAADTAEADHSPESVSVLVSRVRQKLAAAGASDVVETVRGVGYRIRSSQAAHLDPEEETSDRELRDALWRLEETVIEVEHAGTAEQRRAATEALEEARRAVYHCLAE